MNGIEMRYFEPGNDNKGKNPIYSISALEDGYFRCFPYVSMMSVHTQHVHRVIKFWIWVPFKESVLKPLPGSVCVLIVLQLSLGALGTSLLWVWPKVVEHRTLCETGATHTVCCYRRSWPLGCNPWRCDRPWDYSVSWKGIAIILLACAVLRWNLSAVLTFWVNVIYVSLIRH